MAAKKVSIINMKGGVGKTTLSLNLSQYLSELEGKRVLLIDLDPQANATIVGTDQEKLKDHKKRTSDLFINCFKQYGPFPKVEKPKIDYREYIYSSWKSSDGRSFLDIIPSDIYLSSILKGVSVGPYELNRLIIDQVDERYDFIIIDCAPTYSILTTLALNATKAVLIPAMADSFGIYGAKLMKQVINEHEYDYGTTIKNVGLVFTMWKDTSSTQLAWSNDIIKTWGLPDTFKTHISQNDWYKIANGKRISIWDTSAHSAIKREFDSFVEEFLKRIG
jgi:chromosome partitioning protein